MNLIQVIIIIVVIIVFYMTYKRNIVRYPENEIIEGWLQKSDYTSTEYETISEDKVFTLLEEYDWEKEWGYQNDAELKSEDSCPAGIGLIFSKQHILHFCPLSDDKYLVHLHFGYRHKILFLIPVVKQILRTKEKVVKEDLKKMIHLFFEKEFELVKNDMEKSDQ